LIDHVAMSGYTALLVFQDISSGFPV